MHYVAREPEPDRLKHIRLRYTQAWIDYYKHRVGNKPTDRRWREFINDLSVCFNECCGYCEMSCKGEVDHYRPKNKFPELVYEWDNWVFSCHECNHNKGDHWPSLGFVNPCSTDSFCDESQCCFIFDLKTGEVLPHPKLSRANEKKAKDTIRILRLNLTFRLKQRLTRIRHLESLLSLAQYDPRSAADELAYLALQSVPFSSLTKYYVEVNIT